MLYLSQWRKNLCKVNRGLSKSSARNKNNARAKCWHSRHTSSNLTVKHPHTSNLCQLKRLFLTKTRHDTYISEALPPLSDFKLHMLCLCSSHRHISCAERAGSWGRSVIAVNFLCFSKQKQILLRQLAFWSSWPHGLLFQWSACRHAKSLYNFLIKNREN